MNGKTNPDDTLLLAENGKANAEIVVVRPGSPCINTGTNRDWMTNASDLDKRKRIRYGVVDIGAYERINAGSNLMHLSIH